MRDDDLRSSCFASLDVLCARFGEELPYPGGLKEGFAFRGTRVPFLSTQKGIYRAAAQRGLWQEWVRDRPLEPTDPRDALREAVAQHKSPVKARAIDDT